MINKLYEVYCLVDPLFYDDPARARGRMGGGRTDTPEIFSVAQRPLPEGWRWRDNNDWRHFVSDKTPLIPQGWKIHVSTCLDNAERVLGVVWDYCVERGIHFKFLRNRTLLLLRNMKYAVRGGSGKLVTIYPQSEAHAEVILGELSKLLEGEPGPYILSDLRIGAGPLYVRYGGFVPRECRNERGELVSAFQDPSGKLVPDVRTPVFRPPSWVTLPEFLRPHLEARNSTTVSELPYRILKPLHFSNGGGVYLAEDKRTGDKVVLKEGRPYAGLAADGSDAVTRLKHERDVLERLAGMDTVPRLIDDFVLGDHHFLVEEFIEGQPLSSFYAQRSPLLGQSMDPAAVASYTEWSLRILAAVERAVADMHGRGVVFGDIHPFNILVRPDERVALIDFEAARDVNDPRPSVVANAGYQAPRDRTGVDRDRYALSCLRLAQFLPLTHLFLLDRAKAADLAAVIADHFPVPRELLDEAVATIVGPGGAPRVARQPRLTKDPAEWPHLRASLTEAIRASATPGRDDRLFPGDPAQLSNGGIDMAHGAAGVLYALDVAGAGRFPEHEEWLLRAIARASRPRLGFYDGLHGVAYTLERLGYRREAFAIIDRCLSQPWEEPSLDLCSGLAGAALSLDHLAEVTGESALAEASLRAAATIADRLGSVDSVPEISGGNHPYAGLMRGSSGPALLFIRLFERTGDSVFLDHAATALRQDLRRCAVRENGSMHVNEGWRSLPYLDNGSVGIGLVLDRFLVHKDDEQFAEASMAIRRAAQSIIYVFPGLFSGRAGILLYLAHRRDPEVAAQLRRLEWHALSYQGHLAFPGTQLLRLSMDLATGNAGVLLALAAAIHDPTVSLPFLAPATAPR